MKAQDTKTRLLQAGVDPLSLAGLSGITPGQVARAAGLSKSGLFAHFRSKDQLQIDLLHEAARLEAQWHGVLATCGAGFKMANCARSGGQCHDPSASGAA